MAAGDIARGHKRRQFYSKSESVPSCASSRPANGRADEATSTAALVLRRGAERCGAQTRRAPCLPPPWGLVKRNSQGRKVYLSWAVGRSPAVATDADAVAAAALPPSLTAPGTSTADLGGEGRHAVLASGRSGFPLSCALAKLGRSRSSSVVSTGTHFEGALQSDLIWPLSCERGAWPGPRSTALTQVPRPDSGQVRDLGHLLTPTVVG